MMRHVFAYPWLLTCLALLPVLGVLGLWARRRRRQALAQVGGLAAVDALGAGRLGGRLRGLCLGGGLLALGLGMAGPRWGRDWGQATAPGRDLVVVLDRSRSMLAETPTRLERARAALLDLVQALERRGGHRLGLVVFAGRARLVCPLTHDYDHFRATLEAIDPAVLDPELEPGQGTVSGTRIGAALAAAVAAHDPQHRGARDILLLSDGDDPARDSEWRQGAALARAEGIPVFAVGIGDPQHGHRVPGPKGWLTHEGREVSSRMQEAPLRAIAELTHGRAELPGTSGLPLGELYLDTIATAPLRDADDDALPVARPRYAWFLAPAFALIALALVIPDRFRPSVPGGNVP